MALKDDRSLRGARWVWGAAVGGRRMPMVGGRVIIDTSHGHFDIRSEVGGGKRARRP